MPLVNDGCGKSERCESARGGKRRERTDLFRSAGASDESASLTYTMEHTNSSSSREALVLKLKLPIQHVSALRSCRCKSSGVLVYNLRRPEVSCRLLLSSIEIHQIFRPFSLILLQCGRPQPFVVSHSLSSSTSLALVFAPQHGTIASKVVQGLDLCLWITERRSSRNRP